MVWIDGDVAVGGELGQRDLRRSRVQVDGLRADDHERVDVRLQRLQRVE